MPVRLHWHRFPGCGTEHNTACSSVEGRMASCTQAETGPHRGEWGCVHVIGERIELTDLTALVEDLFRELAGPDGRQEQRPK